MEIKVAKQPHQGVIYPGLAMTAFSSAPSAAAILVDEFDAGCL